jgi:hypothetical protein
MRRIGRQANPAERGLQLAMEAPDVLQSMAEQLYLHESDEYTLESLERFRALPDEEQQRWRDKALDLQREHVRSYVPPTDPDDPDPGASRPNEVHRVA